MLTVPSPVVSKMLTPFHHNYEPLQAKQDLNIFGKTLAFAKDFNKALKSEENLQTQESLVVHEIAGPPYYKNEPEMPNFGKKKRRKTTQKPTQKTTIKPILQRLRNKQRRQKLKLRILKELQRLDKQDNLTVMEKSGSFLNKLSGDLSLSRKDFAAELTKWFRRSIWFLAFTAAYTTSPTLLGITVSHFSL